MIFFLVKFFEKKKHAEAFIAGSVHAKKLSYFQEGKDQESFNRSDKHEGVFGWLQPGQGRLVINGMDMTEDLAGPIEMRRTWLGDRYVFCVYAGHSGDIDLNDLSAENIEALRRQLEIPEDCHKLGKYAVIVKNVPEFIDRIQKRAELNQYRMFCGSVKYYNPKTFHGQFMDEQAIFRKHDDYKHHREYRFVIDSPDRRVKSVTLDIEDIRDIAMECDTEDINQVLLGGGIEMIS